MLSDSIVYHMPAEWEPHARSFLSWPVRASMCFPEDYERVCKGYAEFAAAISEFEPVTILINSGEEQNVRQMLGNTPAQLLEIAHNDAWLRDNGPTFLIGTDGSLAGVNWKFNAWGGKYAPWDLDDQVAPRILEHVGVRCLDAPFVMEGGSFHTDGAGTLLTTEECLLNPNRNPNMSKAEIEAQLKAYLGVKKVIWLRRGLDGDETDGHVDNIACFAAPGKVLMQTCDDPADPNYEITQENMEILRTQTDARGQALQVISIAQPPRKEHKGQRLTLSYLNFYFVNEGIILPVFGDTAEQTDKQAIQTLEALYPDRRVRPVDGMAIIREGGNIHCATQQMPAVTG